jgi:hypothetical protein
MRYLEYDELCIDHRFRIKNSSSGNSQSQKKS